MFKKLLHNHFFVILFQLNLQNLHNFIIVVIINDFKPVSLSDEVAFALCESLVDEQGPFVKGNAISTNDILLLLFW
jgi:hypothetical protein